ncbi:MAG: hypothetical protein J6T48_05265 [Bacteroidales bacterium]|nr:hypothetical protein [Bacteroidales bacterium]
MKRILLFVTMFILVAAFMGCHKNPLDYGNVGVLNLNLQRGYKTMNKGALESFDARVTIYYSENDTISYNCRFVDTDGDGLYNNDPTALDNLYVRREVGFWVGVWAVIQGDTVTGMSDPTNLLYLSEENPLIDVYIVLISGYPRIVLNANPMFDGESFMLHGEVLEGIEQIEQFGFLMRPGQLSDEEKRIWSKRVLTRLDLEELFASDYYGIEGMPVDNDANKFVGQVDMGELSGDEYSVVAFAMLRMNDNDTIEKIIHSSFATMKFSLDGVYIDEPYYNGDTVTLYAYYAGSSQVNECGFVLGFSDNELTDTMPCRLDGASFSYSLYGFQPNTTYYFKAYVKTADGTIVSEETGQFQITGMIQEFGVYTESATEITESSATLNGYVTSTDGVHYCGFILNMGTYNDTIMVESFAGGSFSYQVSNLTASTTYYYQAFAIRDGWDFGQEVSFATANSGQQGTSYSQPTGNMDGYGYVDLGLPSGLLWAYSNIGATNPEDYGNYYAWGETEPKETYDWSTYRYCNGSDSTLTKYCNNSSYGNEGFTDTLTILEADDDAATANWGTNWRMPTLTEMTELRDNCDTTWTAMNGINGMLFTSRTNGNSIFLPAAGLYIYDAGSYGYYWSSSLYSGSPGNSIEPYYACYLNFYSIYYYMSADNRYYGLTVRPVCVSQKKSVLPPKRAK